MRKPKVTAASVISTCAPVVYMPIVFSQEIKSDLSESNTAYGPESQSMSDGDEVAIYELVKIGKVRKSIVIE